MRQRKALKNPLPNLAYANDFALNQQPSAYFKLVPGCLIAQDEYARRFYCLTCGQNMESLFIYLHILNMWIILLCMHTSTQILNMQIHFESICIIVILVHVHCVLNVVCSDHHHIQAICASASESKGRILQL